MKHYVFYGDSEHQSAACIEFVRLEVACQRYSLVLQVKVSIADTAVKKKWLRMIAGRLSRAIVGSGHANTSSKGAK